MSRLIEWTYYYRCAIDTTEGMGDYLAALRVSLTGVTFPLVGLRRG
jgi:hypothetical protein